MIRKKVKLLRLVQDLRGAALEIYNWTERELSGGEDSNHMHDLFSDKYPFDKDFNSVLRDIAMWANAISDYKIVIEEILINKKWDRIVYLQKTSGKLTGLNVMHGASDHDVSCFVKNEIGYEYNRNDERMLKFYYKCIELNVYAATSDFEERLHEIISLYFSMLQYVFLDENKKELK